MIESESEDMILPAPRLVPPLDPDFRPAALAYRAFLEECRRSGRSHPVRMALEQADGTVEHFSCLAQTGDTASVQRSVRYLERTAKFLLWSRGGFRISIEGPTELSERLSAYYRDTPQGRFDAAMLGERVYGRPFEVVTVEKLPEARPNLAPLGRNWDGCRIGFDLGASDRKVAAVKDGECLFSEEVEWNPVPQTDPQWHFDQIMHSLRRAAEHLPRVDAIGGSSAGVIVNGRIKVASLFRGVPPDLFARRVQGLFGELQAAWGGIPFEVANDGEVTALAGSMAIGVNSILGIALGSSQAAGFVTPTGQITSWLNELAFAPVDYNPHAPKDEWSGDQGCGAQYFSQQAVGRLMPRAGIECDPQLPLPEKLKVVQSLMEAGDERAWKIYRTIGTYLGYAVAHYADFYSMAHVLLLGRVTSGAGGTVILQTAQETLRTEFPERADEITFHTPDERQKRHGQAIAAASLPRISSEPHP